MDGRDEWDRVRKKGLELKPTHLNGLNCQLNADNGECFGLHEAGDGLVGRIDKHAGKFLTGEWLEAFFWGLLTRHEQALDLDHVHLGVEAGKVDTNATTDFDVAFMHNQSLGAVECKSGSQEHSDDPNAPLDKLEARIQQFRALRVNSILATTSPKILDAERRIKPTFAARAAIYGCRIVTVDHIRQLARDPDSHEPLRTILFGSGQNQES